MQLSLTGKNALVCGGSKGIGKAAAYELANLGATVTLMARSHEVLADVVKDLDQVTGNQHDFLVVDFSNSADLKEKVTMLTLKKPIHILVNNTGGPPGGPIVEAETEAFVQAFHNHLVCNHILTQAIVSGMKSSGYGRIINIISTSVKQPLEGLGVSNTIRGAVANWAKTMANELAPFGITVNNVLPGATETERLRQIIDSKAEKTNQPAEMIAENMKNSVPLKRFAQPEEIAAAVAFLASPAAAYINGINLPVDGGRTKSL